MLIACDFSASFRWFGLFWFVRVGCECLGGIWWLLLFAAVDFVATLV